MRGPGPARLADPEDGRARSFVTYTAAAAAHLERSRNGELAGEINGLTVLASQAGQVRRGLVQPG